MCFLLVRTDPLFFLCIRLNGKGLSAAISHSLFEAITFHLVSHKILLFFHSGKLNHLTYWTSTNWCQPHFIVSNKIQNIRQHRFEANKWLIFYYALSRILQVQLEGQCGLMTNFETLVSPIYKHFSLFFGGNFCISPYLMSFMYKVYIYIYIYIYIHQKGQRIPKSFNNKTYLINIQQ